MTARTHPLAAAVLTVGCLLPAAAAAADSPLTGHALATWAERDGVPIGAVRAITQDAQGYLWLGTESGVVRFDGVRFLTADALEIRNMPAGEIHALLLGGDGALWVGLHELGGLHVLTPTMAATAERLLADVSVNDLAQTRDGVVWAATDQGLFAIASRHAQRAEIDAGAGSVLSVSVDARDQLWVGTAQGLYRREPDGSFTPVANLTHVVRDVSEARAGALWTTHPTLGFTQVAAQAPVDHVFEGVGTDVLVDTRGSLWVGTRGQGLWRVYRDALEGQLVTERASVDMGLLSDGIWALHEDRDGNIWVGTHEGLHRFMPHLLTPITSLGLARAVTPHPGGGIWVGTASGLLRVTRETGTNQTRISGEQTSGDIFVRESGRQTNPKLNRPRARRRAPISSDL
jgi:ligand-binding sensor domain-containing protein